MLNTLPYPNAEMARGQLLLDTLITPLHAVKTKTQVSDRICMRILKRIYKTITESN